MSRFVVLTGLSGAGRSLAAGHLEDLGWPVVENLPSPLLPRIVELVDGPGPVDRVALALGAGLSEGLAPTLNRLRDLTASVRVLFLDARTDTLVRRYQATRRRHPLSGENLGAAIRRERRLLAEVRAGADVVLDTSDLSTHALRGRIATLFGADTVMNVTLLSFGYKHGLPLDADVVLDCRFLPNPHWVDRLRPFTGLHQEVSDWVLNRPAAVGFLERLRGLLASLLPAYAAEGRPYLTVALGCTGGRHRSVAITERVAEELRRLDYAPTVQHRDVAR